MTQKQIDKFLYEDCECFNGEQSLEEYTADICKYLTLCSWKYTKENAEKTVKQYEEYIKNAFDDKTTVGDVALDIGYSCG